jgi:aspartyl-tRNA(Asn)/glutamyl-tRNA(Gln) amidotransferase subunit A
MPFNLTGNPAVSLPCGFDRDGMPLAIQLVARPGADAELLRVAAAFESARPWAERTPATVFASEAKQSPSMGIASSLRSSQ